MNTYTQVDYARSALITIDTQCDTLDGQPFEIAGTSAVLANMLALLEEYRRVERPIVHIVRIYKRNGTNADSCRRSAIEDGMQLFLEGHAGCELAADLFPGKKVRLQFELLLSGGIQPVGNNEVIIYKPRWGAFYKTPLEKHLAGLDVNSLIFSGCNFPNCPRTSIYQASERDYRIALAQDAISGLYPRGEKELQNIGIKVLTTAQLITDIQKGQ